MSHYPTAIRTRPRCLPTGTSLACGFTLRQTAAIALASLCVALTTARATADDASPATVDYMQHVRPILARSCYRCHGPLKQEQGLRLDTVAAMITGGDSGTALAPGKPADSLLLGAIMGDAGFQMPKQGPPLSPDEVAVIRAWIDQGAVAPGNDVPADPLDHWSFRSVVRPEVPHVADASWVRNPIDNFVAAQRDQRGLAHQPEAPRHVLLRRVYLDLIGLPPTREELQTFLDDTSSDAYERAVERLLASPQYGERWGRHWMDVWRYSDWAGWTDGGQIRDSQPHIWRWRDWIVDSLNADKPYDRMVVEMLAADELEPADPDALAATGFLVRNYKMLSREIWMQDTVEHTAKAFLGLTLNCARCHDHMYDPILQEDYYRWRAIFEPHQVRIDRVPGQLDTKLDGLPRVYDADLAVATYLYVRGDDRNPDKDHPLAPGVPRVFASLGKYEPVREELDVPSYYPDLRQFVRSELLAATRADVTAKEQQLAATREAHDHPDAAKEAAVREIEAQLAVSRAKLASLEARIAADVAKFAKPQAENAGELAQAAAMAERQADVAAAELAVLQADREVAQVRAAGEEAQKKLPEAEKKLADARADLDAKRMAAQSPGESYTSVGTAYPQESTGRRLALAQWITAKENPLTARVAANQIWMRHFGQPLVASVSDFGRNGTPPTHPALLDWLAAELVEPSDESAQPWSMKHLHRLIVTSSTYRMASTADQASLHADPDNVYLWRMAPRRMEAEVVRDSVLSASGALDTTRGGPDLDQNQGMTIARRSMYFRHAPEKQMEFLKLFDAAAPTECYRRKESVMPQQALALANSALVLQQSRRLARTLAGEAVESEDAGDADRAFVAATFEQVLSRRATPEEIATCVRFLDEQQAFFRDNAARLTGATADGADLSRPSGDPRLRARENLVHVLFNHNDFVTIR